MPRTGADYSNTVIYKIYCKDVNIKEIYIGQTVCFNYRKNTHRLHCNRSPENKRKVYQFINANGGWSNWIMEQIDCVNCKNITEAKKHEGMWIFKLGASLNTNKTEYKSFDMEIINIGSTNNVQIHKENTKIKHQKEAQELKYLRSENMRLKQLLLETSLKSKIIKII